MRYVEKRKLPFSKAPKDDRRLPDMHLGLYNDVVVFDNVEKKAYVIHWVRLDDYSSLDEAFKNGQRRLDILVSRVQDVDPPRLSSGSVKVQTGLFGAALQESSMTSEQYKKAVVKAQEHILAGDIFQIVLSQRFERRTFADPFEVYRALRVVNPSPYMIYLQARGCILVASSPEIDEYYSDVRYDRIAILNALGAYYSNICKIETKQREKEEFFIRATHYYNKASRIDMHEPSTWVGKGQLLLAKGDLEQAYGAFKIVLDGQADNIPALLGQACVQFNRGRHADSLELYKKALQVYPGCPATVKLGLDLCRYKIGQFRKARQAFERVLQLDPENVEALVALGIMELQINESEGIHEGMKTMRMPA